MLEQKDKKNVDSMTVVNPTHIVDKALAIQLSVKELKVTVSLQTVVPCKKRS